MAKCGDFNKLIGMVLDYWTWLLCSVERLNDSRKLEEEGETESQSSKAI